MIKKVMILMIFSSLVIPVFSTVSLEDAVKAGILKNSKLKNLILDKNIDKLKAISGKREKLFKVELNGSYMYRSEKIHMQLPDLNVSPQMTIPGMSFDAGSLHNFDLNLRVTQPVFTGGVLSNSVKILGKKVEMDKSTGDLLKTNISTMVKSSYYRYKLLHNTELSIEVIKEKIETHKKRVKDFFSEGLSKKSDLIETTLKLKELELELLNIRAEMNEERNRFFELCGIDVNLVDNRGEIIAPFEQMAIEKFFKVHPALTIYKNNKEIININKKIVSGSYLPQMVFFSEFHYGRPGINFFENEWKFYIQSGISIKLRLFDWGRLGRKKNVLDYMKLKIRNGEEDFIRSTKIKIKSLYEKIAILKRSLGKASDLISSAIKDSELKKNLYDEEQISNLDYLDSLLNIKKYETLKNKIILQLEFVKISVNNLVGEEVDK